MTIDPVRCVYPNVRPKDASTLILLDRSGATPKVLVGRRHAGHEFMPSKFVFPGGRVEIGDRRVPVAGELDPEDEARLMRRTEQPSRAKARAFAIAAVREAFEETGLLIGKRLGGDAAKLPDGPWRAFADAGVQPDLSEFRFIARAVTPPRRPRRFDTRFFALDARAIAHRIDGMVGPDAELVELIWLPIADAQKLDILPITRTILAGLEPGSPRISVAICRCRIIERSDADSRANYCDNTSRCGEGGERRWVTASSRCLTFRLRALA